MTDELSILCERCGYPVGSLPRSLACPECGYAIEMSHPDHRRGSPWQRNPGVRGYLRTGIESMRHPIAGWSDVAVERTASSALLWLHAAVAAAIFPGLALFLVATSNSAAPVAVFAALIWFAGLLLLSTIETVGVRVIGRVKRVRISRDVVYSIVGHAGSGWIIGAVIGVGMMFFMPRDQWTMSLRWAGISAGVAAGTGLFCFETLTWLGMRKMKYANAAAPPRDG